MNEPANHWKLGLFVVLATMLFATGVVYLGTTSLRKETVAYTSYFDESVTGLDVGSPVRFRGVNVGKVVGIDIAPDRRQVEITYELGVSVLAHLGLASPHGQATKLAIPPDLRVQLGSAGVTGVKYILIDFFDVKTNPRPVLTFRVPANYIPSAASTMKNLEDTVVRAMSDFPAISNQLLQVLQHVDHILVDIDGKHFSDRASATFDRLDQTLANMDATLAVTRARIGGIDTVGLSNQAKTVLANLDATMTRAQAMMARVDGDKGVLASVQRASDSIGDVAVDARGHGAELSAALRDLSEAAQSIRALTDALELDSDMLLKGRSKGSK